MFTLRQTSLAGVLTLFPSLFTDHRGTFVKTFQDAEFRNLGVAFEPKEEFFSTSHRGVIRGMHFQVPPADHCKLVYCVTGAVLDVILDLRRDSATYGRTHAEELSAENRRLVYIPSGFAHGFLTLSESALMVYKTSTAHVPACDKGVHWNSFGFDWPLNGGAPILSKRDTEFPSLADFKSPF